MAKYINKNIKIGIVSFNRINSGYDKYRTLEKFVLICVMVALGRKKIFISKLFTGDKAANRVKYSLIQYNTNSNTI